MQDGLINIASVLENEMSKSMETGTIHGNSGKKARL